MKQPTLYVAIGPSGSGKSTYYRNLVAKEDVLHYSWDALRHEWYDEGDYANAFKLSTQDKDFNRKVMAHFQKLLATGKSIFVDNTNLTPKRRGVYINAAKNAGYKTVAVMFNVPVETLIARQNTRGDKKVPEDVVRQQHKSMVLPQANEFDQVEAA